MEIVIGNYRIRPYRGYTCWQIERKGKYVSGANAGQEYWMAAEKFPSTISCALEIVLELNLRENNTKTDDLKKAIDQIKAEIKKFEDQIITIENAAKGFEENKKDLEEVTKGIGRLEEIEVEEKPRKRRGRPPKNKK